MREVSYSGIWKKTRLGDLIVITTGKLDANAAVVDGAFPFFTCAESVSKIDVWAFDTSAVLLAGNGSFSVKHYSGKFNAYQRTYVIEPIEISTKFLFWLIKGHIRAITENERGSTIPYIRKGDITDIELFLPPLAEQKAIAEKLDTLLAQVESTKVRLKRIPKILKRFRQSVLAAAVSGKLTEEWREMSDLDMESWVYEAAQIVCEKVQSGSTPKGKPFSDTGGVPFLKVYNIVNQEIDFDYRPQFVSEEVHAEKLKRSIGYPGDVLMNIVGPPLGKVAVLPEDYPEWNFNQALTLFRPDKSKLLANFLYYVLCEGALVRDVVHDLKGIVGQVNISLTQCRKAIIPCPSLEEQTEIVRRVDQLFVYADTIETQVNNALARVNNLTQSILAKAFRGELTEQWRKDNPDLISGENSAEALLEKIKAERAAAKPVKRGRKKAK